MTTRKPPDPKELKTFRVNLPADLHRQIKIQAAKEDRKIQELVADALEAYLKKRR